MLARLYTQGAGWGMLYVWILTVPREATGCYVQLSALFRVIVWLSVTSGRFARGTVTYFLCKATSLDISRVVKEARYPNTPVTKLRKMSRVPVPGIKIRRRVVWREEHQGIQKFKQIIAVGGR